MVFFIAGWTVAGAIIGAVGATVAGDNKYPAVKIDYNWLLGIRAIAFQ